MNGDRVLIGSYVVVRNTVNPMDGPFTLVCRLAEVLRMVQRTGLLDVGVQKPDHILLEVMNVGSTPAYQMPSLSPSGHGLVIALQVSLPSNRHNIPAYTCRISSGQ